MAGKKKAPSDSGRAPKKDRKRGSPLTSDYVYDDDETEFLKAVGRFKQRTGKKFPSYAELLGVLKSLGYKKGI